MGTSSTKGGSKSPTTSHNPSPPRPDGTRSDAKNQEPKPEPASSTDANRPLAPPPKPGTSVDYFSNKPPGSLSLEPNPFEQSFGVPGPETPGGTKLPSVAALASPSSMLPGTGNTPFNWPGSLRSGPLSPAMLSGPTSDYFSDSHTFKGGFPTPNESSLRTGLTPGGNGSMFPAPSPGTASLFASLHAAGGATPNTLEFQRTAISAAAKRDHPPAVLPPPNTSQQNTSAPISTMAATMAPPIESKHAYDHHDNDAANGLFMLAQSRSGHGVQPFPPGPGPAPTSAPLSHPTSAPNRVTLPQQQPAASANAGPSMTTSPVTNGARGASEASGASDDGERLPHVGRSSHKKSNNTSASARRKAEDHLTKTPVSKKIKMSSASPNDDMDNFSDEESMVKMEDANRGDDGDKTKMTDEEKRKNFLERNRVAALKCRQRKKQWLQSLQNKVELFNNENEVLLQENQRLKEEVVNLKTLLMAHKDCPVTQQQGVPGNAYIPPGAMDSFGAMSYGMGAPMPNQQTIIAGQSRRFS